MSRRLEGRVAVVTGGARNIGRAVGERLAAEGARVALADIEESVAQTASEIGGETVGYRTDVSSAADVDRLFDDVLERWGTVDILVNNAAKVIGAVRHFLEADEEWWDSVLDVNLKGHFLCARRAAAVMAPAGRGVIVNFSSGGATRAHRGMTAYDASKGGIEALTRALALDLAPYGIRSVCVVPGLIFQHWQDEERRRAGCRDGAARANRAAARHRGRGCVPRLGRRVVHHRDDPRSRRRPAVPAALAAGRDLPGVHPRLSFRRSRQSPPASEAPSSGAGSGRCIRSGSARGSPGARARPPRTARPARPR